MPRSLRGDELGTFTHGKKPSGKGVWREKMTSKDGGDRVTRWVTLNFLSYLTLTDAGRATCGCGRHAGWCRAGGSPRALGGLQEAGFR